MEESGSSVKIEKLNDSNFHAWKQKIVLLLALRDLDEHIDDDARAPEDDPEKLKWEKGDRKAKAVIGLSLSDEQLEHVRDVRTAKEMWDTILDVFEKQTLLNKLTARRRFYTATMHNGEKMLSYINRVKQMAATLKSMGVTIDDEELAMALLNGLPSSYESLIVALDALGSESKVFTFDHVRSRLMQEEQRAELRDQSSSKKSDSSALLNIRENGRNEQPKNERSLQTTWKCTNCGRSGHTADRCWGQDVNGKRPPAPADYTGKKSQQKANAVTVNSGDDNKNEVANPAVVYTCLMAKLNDSSALSGVFSWVIDSGCTAHMTFDRSLFCTYERVSGMNVEMGTKAKADVVGRGDVNVKVTVGSETSYCRLQNVLHIPTFEYSLISVGQMDRNGIRTSFENGRCEIAHNNKIVATGLLRGSLYVLKAQKPDINTVKAHVATLDLWHRRLAHVNKKGISQMASQGVVRGLKFQGTTEDSFCEGCIAGKAHRADIPKERTSGRAEGLLDLVHSDVCGPMQVTSLGGSRYFITFIDDYSNWVVIYAIRQKSESADCYMNYEKFAERQTGRKIRVVRSDRGGEYLSNVLEQHFESSGIKHELTAAFTPFQNGVAERLNRTLMELVRSMLHAKGLSKRLWAEALSTATYVRNRVSSRALPPKVTPHHLWKRCPPIMTHMRVFGSQCWYTVPKQKLQKLDSRSCPAIFVGYAEQSKAFKLIDLESKKVVVSRDVIFDESRTPKFDTNQNFVHNENDCNERMVSLEHENIVDTAIENASSQMEADETAEAETAQNTQIDGVSLPGHDDGNDFEEELDADFEGGNPESEGPNDDHSSEPLDEGANADGAQQPTLRRSVRTRKAPGAWWKAFITVEPDFRGLLTTETPLSYKQAVTGPNAKFWKSGIDRELSSLVKYKTWKFVPRSEAKNILTSKWIFKTKEIVENGNVENFPKGRLVARGFQQVEGVDFGETFSPVVKFTSIRALLALVAHMDLELHQMDVVTAFLNGDVSEDIYMEIPEGVEHDRKKEVVCKLNRALYGLKQAPRCWNKKIDPFLVEQLGFQKCEGDPCLYVKYREDGVLMIIALYVDDLLLAGNDISGIKWMKNELNKRFEMKDLGEAKLCLGLEITRDRPNRRLHLTQSKYIVGILERFGMEDSKPVATPMEGTFSYEDRVELDCSGKQEGIMTNVPYREAIGSLMYLMIGTRPDLAFCVGKLSQFCEAPKERHWVAVKRVLRYVSGTRTHGILFDGSKSIEAHGFSDSDWAGDVSDRKSVSGYAFLMAGGVVSWSSRKQTVVATSSCEAEYIAMSVACKESLWLERIVRCMPPNAHKKRGMVVFSDSQSGIKLSQNESINRRNKHIDVTFHFVRDVVARGDVELCYKPTSEMTADLMTKPLGRVKFEYFRELCGIRSQGEILKRMIKGEC